MDTDNSPVDREPLLALTGGDIEFANELLQEFARDRRAEGARLIQMLADGSPPTDIFPLAHRLKGSCNMIGATAAGQICLEIEHAARAGDRDLERFSEPLTRLWGELFAWLEAEGLA